MMMAKRRKVTETTSADASDAQTVPLEVPAASGPSKDMPTYLLLVLRGLEFLVVEEIREKLQVEYLQVISVEKDAKYPNNQYFQGEAAVGRILLQTTSTVQEVKALQSIQAVLAFIAKSDDIVTDDACGVKQVAKLAMDADWEPAMQLWKEHMRVLRPDTFDETATPTFRGSCVRDGRHAYKSVAIAGELGGDIATQFNWRVDLSHFDLEVVCILLYQYVVVGISLADPAKIQYRNKMAAEDRRIMADSQYVSTLRPSTTYLMLKLAEYEAGDVLLDSMCGVGTIPICCAAFAQDGIFALGGELDTMPVEKAGQNAVARPCNVDVLQWDSTCLPLRDECVDKIIIDLPFGVNCGTARQLSKSYPKIMKELYRVMRSGSRAVLLTSLKKTFNHSVSLVPWRVVASHEVNIGGLLGGIYVIEK